MGNLLSLEYSGYLKNPTNVWKLVDALLQCRCLADATGRDTVVRQMEQTGIRPVKLTGDPQLDVKETLVTCLSFPGAFKQFLEVVRKLDHPNSLEWIGVEDTLREIINPGYISAAELQALSALIPDGAIAPDEVKSIYRDSLPDRVAPRPDVESVSAAVRHLADLQPRTDPFLYRSLEFIERVAYNIQDKELRESLRDWSNSLADKRGLTPNKLADFRDRLRTGAFTVRTARHALLIELTPHPGNTEDQYSVRLVRWQNDDPVGDTVEIDKPVPIDEVKTLLRNHLQAVDRELGKAANALTLEVSVPRKYLCLAADQWELNPMAPLPLGYEYCVVVRWSMDDQIPRKMGRWQERWDTLQDLPRTTDANVLWVQRPDEFPGAPDIFRMLDACPELVCLGVEFAPHSSNGREVSDHFSDSFYFFIFGVPVALWLRTPRATPEEARSKLKEILGDSPLHELPDRVRRWRVNDRLKDVTLYWDNPYRVSSLLQQPKKSEGSPR